MRHIIPSLGLAALLLAAGCNNWPQWRQNQNQQVRQFDRTPTADQLVEYLNQNAQRVQGLECRQVFIDAEQGGQKAGLDATLVCQKRRDFRLVGRAVGQTEVDMGSKGQEVCYWLLRAQERTYV